MTATQTILALNHGSTSLKGALFSLPTESGAEAHAPRELQRISVDAPRASTHAAGIDAEAILDAAIQRFTLLNAPPDIIAHRIVHGGDAPGPMALDAAVLAQLERWSTLAPLHQPPALALARMTLARWPGARQVAAFDTSWHQTMPERHRRLAIPHALHRRGVKRYGFHGLAFQSAMRQLSDLAPGVARGRVVLAHLGGGSSLCAVRDGRSVSTTMGMTPLDGLPMSTRPGSLDAGVVLHLQRELGMTPDAVDHMLWHDCGLQGMSGESGDMRTLMASHSDRARSAVDAYVSAVAQGIAGMAACIGGMDALVFSGGIGAGAADIRARVVAELAWMGLRIDAEANVANSRELSTNDGAVRCFALEIDEELELVLAASHSASAG